MAKDHSETTHGRVRYVPESAIDGEPEISITLGGTNHIMRVDEALALANRIILTSVDKETRYAG